MGIEVEWARMTAPDLRAIAARKGALAILPAGSLEQHGPHLPVITDTASASAASIAAARLVVEGPDPVPVAVLPGLWLGLSEHHLPFGGTISVDYAAYRAILESIVRSLRASGFARLLIVNGHGGNIDPLAVASRELAVAYDLPIVATTPWFLAPAKIAAILSGFRNHGVDATIGKSWATANSRDATASGSMLPPWPLTISKRAKPSARSDRTMFSSIAR